MERGMKCPAKRKAIPGYLLYEKVKGIESGNTVANMDIRRHKITPFSLYAKDEKRNASTTLLRLYFWVITFNSVELFYVLKKNNTIHTSYTLRSKFKFPFCEKTWIEIGPCFTDPAYRGEGIYPSVIQHIVNNTDATNYFMIVEKNNKASIRGIEKSGFLRTGQIRKTKGLKRYEKVSGYKD